MHKEAASTLESKDNKGEAAGEGERQQNEAAPTAAQRWMLRATVATLFTSPSAKRATAGAGFGGASAPPPGWSGGAAASPEGRPSLDGRAKRVAERMRAVRHMVRVQRMQRAMGRSLSLRSEGTGSRRDAGPLAQLAKRREQALVKVPPPLRLLGREQRAEGAPTSSRDRLELVAAGVSPHIGSRPQTARQRLREYKRQEAERTRQMQERERAAEARRRRARMAPMISRSGYRRNSVAVDATARALRPSTASGRMRGPPSLTAPRRAVPSPNGRGGGAALTSPYAASQSPESRRRGPRTGAPDASASHGPERRPVPGRSSSASLGGHAALGDPGARDGRAALSETSEAQTEASSPPGRGGSAQRGRGGGAREAVRSRRGRGDAPHVVTKELRDEDSVERWALGLPRLFMRDSRAVAIFGRPCGGRLTVTWAARAPPRKGGPRGAGDTLAPVAAAREEGHGAAGGEARPRPHARLKRRPRPARPRSASAARSSSVGVRSRPSPGEAGTRLGERRSPAPLGAVRVRAVDDMVIQGSASAGDGGGDGSAGGGEHRPQPTFLDLGSSLDGVDEGEVGKGEEADLPARARATPGSTASKRSAALARELLDELDGENDGRGREAAAGDSGGRSRDSPASEGAEVPRAASTGPGSSQRAGSAASDLDARSTVDGAKSLLAQLRDERAEGPAAFGGQEEPAPEDGGGGSSEDGPGPDANGGGGGGGQEGGRVAAGEEGVEGEPGAKGKGDEADDLFDLGDDDDDEADSDVEAFLQSQA